MQTDSVDYAAAVEVGVAAFCAGVEPPADEAVWRRLTEAGVAPWLAERLLVLLPMAFTRRLVPEISYPDALTTRTQRVILSAEPVFVAALARAQVAARAEVKRIALRSSEFAAINSALYAGSQLPDLRLSEVVRPDDLVPVEPGDGGVPSVREVFETAIRGNGVVLDDQTAIDARLVVHPVQPPAVLAQVEFAVAHPTLARLPLLESFAGQGTTWREAIGGTVDQFLRGSLAPIVDGLLRPGAMAGKVTRQHFDHRDGAFQLVLGPQLPYFAEQQVGPAMDLLDRVLDALGQEWLSRKVHSFRIFQVTDDGRLVGCEALLDSEPWGRGETAVQSSPAPLPTGRVGVRIFGLLIPS